MGGCTGDNDITKMWGDHYQQLYDSVNDSDRQETLKQRIACTLVDQSSKMTIVVDDVIAACASQKRGKAVGLDCIAMEAFIHGGTRLYVHLCMLFNDVAFSALTLLVGRQEGHPACKKLSGGMLAWLSVWTEVQTCIWPS